MPRDILVNGDVKIGVLSKVRLFIFFYSMLWITVSGRERGKIRKVSGSVIFVKKIMGGKNKAFYTQKRLVTLKHKIESWSSVDKKGS